MATSIEELRSPHPDQKRIDAEAAVLLRATAPARITPPERTTTTRSPLPGHTSDSSGSLSLPSLPDPEHGTS